MPVRLLSSSVLKWPSAATALEAARRWAAETAAQRADVLGIGVFGSCARGDWGVGSDLDLVVIVDNARRPFDELSDDWNVSRLPVPADVVVYSLAQWEQLPRESRVWRTHAKETIWLLRRGQFGALERDGDTT